MGEDIQVSEVHAILSELAGCEIASLKNICGGKNSKVYRLFCNEGVSYIAKFYFQHDLDKRDRLETEFSSLNFLWKNHIRCIPRPIAADKKSGCAIYEHIEGESINAEEVTATDIDSAVQFLAILKKLKGAEGSASLNPASEACFSVRAIISNIEQRLNRLTLLEKESNIYDLLSDFLSNEFLPCFDKINQWCKTELDKAKISRNTEIRSEERTLSPSDFGFHNALMRSDGQLVFLDFEYFGWDDPAKMISDFLLHPAPAMNLSENLKKRFVSQILYKFGEYKHLSERLEIVYPLFGLKWCMIFLNEFVPEHLSRREFSAIAEMNRGDIQIRQLAKARKMLNRIKSEYENFPYRN